VSRQDVNQARLRILLAHAAGAEGTEGLAAAVEEALAAARAEHPDIDLPEELFLAALAKRLDGQRTPADCIRALHASDVFLATACAAGHVRATHRFDLTLGQEAARARRRFDATVLEEAKQNVRQRLLVGGTYPKIADFDGRAPLRRWVRVVLTREAILLAKRGKRDEMASLGAISVAAAADDPEMAFMKKRYRELYRDAVAGALGELDARDRAVLRQHYVLGMTVDELATVYEVHRATAARWVQSARETLLAKARLRLTLGTGLPRAEIEEIVRLIQSQLEVSLDRLLRDDKE